MDNANAQICYAYHLLIDPPAHLLFRDEIHFGKCSLLLTLRLLAP